MADATATTDAAAQTSSDSTDTTATATGATADTSTTAETTADDAGLGDAGKKALDAMKAERKAAKDLAATEKARADALQAKLDGKEAEHLAAQEKAAADKLILDKANQRILKSEVKAAAKGVLADPQDAYKFLDLDVFEVDDDGNVDEDVIAKALADLVKSKPYLAAQGGKFGNPDGGPRNGGAKSIDDQIAEATKAGNHALAISLKRQKAYASTT